MGGATIMLSGMALMVSFLFLALFPVDIVTSMGIGSVITMLCLVIVNLTLVPAVLAAFPGSFATGLTEPSSGMSARCFRCTRVGWRWLAGATTRFPHNLFLLLFVIAGS